MHNSNFSNLKTLWRQRSKWRARPAYLIAAAVVAAVSILATTTGPVRALSMLSNPSSGGPGFACRGLMILMARGTRGSTDTSHSDGQINAAWDRINSAHVPGGIGGDGTTDGKPWLDPYDAPTIGTYFHWPIAAQFKTDVRQGITDMAGQLNQVYKYCPQSAVALIGYSAGAAVVKGVYLSAVTTTVRRQRTLVALYGDPYYVGKDVADTEPVPKLDGGIASRWPVGTNVYFPQEWARPNIWDTCLPGDPVCNVPWYIGSVPWLATLVQNIGVHMNGYVAKGNRAIYVGVVPLIQRYEQLVSKHLVI